VPWFLDTSSASRTDDGRDSIFTSVQPSSPRCLEHSLIVLFSCGYNIETCKIIDATFLTLHFCPMRDFSQVKGGHGPIGPMVNTLVIVAIRCILDPKSLPNANRNLWCQFQRPLTRVSTFKVVTLCWTTVRFYPYYGV